jgi:type I restriction enzyme S subunit
MASNWHRTAIGNHIDLLTGFPFGSEHYTEETVDVRLLRGDNVIQGTIRWEDVKRWPVSQTADLERYQLAENDIVIAMDRTWVKAGLKIAQIKKKDTPSLLVQRVARLRAKGELDQDYLAQCINGYRFEQYVKGSQTETAVPHISPRQICDFTIPFPRIEEQRKIAAILRTWDEAIENLDWLFHSLETLSSALRQKYFEKQFACDKSLAKASRIFEPVSERARPDLPLLAVMQDLGVVRRDELDRRVAMPDGDISNYKVVRPGDFVISLRSFEGGLEYSKVLGLVSPAYTVLRPIREINGDYYRHFFKSRSFIGRLDKLIFGIRDGKQIAFRDFGDMRIPNPSFKVQESDAAALNQAASLLELNQKRKQSLEKQKRGLMQKLLTGQWRVKA